MDKGRPWFGRSTVQAERLNPETRQGCDSPNSTNRLVEGREVDPKRLTRLEIGHKSNRMTRDMLAATASFINCTGGVNGDIPTEITRSDVDEVVRTLLDNNAYTIMDKRVVHVKSSLIILKAEVAIS
jgi:hypothetical protein